jgi:hypothetical protein
VEAADNCQLRREVLTDLRKEHEMSLADQPRKIEIRISGDWERDGFDGPERWVYSAASIGDDDKEDGLIFDQRANLADMLHYLLDKAFAEGFSRAFISSVRLFLPHQHLSHLPAVRDSAAVETPRRAAKGQNRPGEAGAEP